MRIAPVSPPVHAIGVEHRHDFEDEAEAARTYVRANQTTAAALGVRRPSKGANVANKCHSRVRRNANKGTKKR